MFYIIFNSLEYQWTNQKDKEGSLIYMMKEKYITNEETWNWKKEDQLKRE